ncbi:MAG: WD40 repeat domain-containing protein [Spirochaetes bacterium]|nr:WD40 repeat domain-containing protein [Spirochaetota bacterium]
MNWKHLLEGILYVLLAWFVYFVALPDRFAKVPYTRLLWHHDLNGPDLSTRDVDLSDFPDFKTRHFHFRTNLFYFDRTGDTRFRLAFDPLSFCSASSRNYITYSKVGKISTLYSDAGERQWQLDSYGYPILSPSGNRFFVLSSDAQSATLWDINRTVLASNVFLGSLVTDWQYCGFNDDLVLGTLDGDVWVFDYRGRLTFREKPGESRTHYIKSVSVSAKGAWVATLSGLDPERLTLWNRDGVRQWSLDTGYGRRERQSIFLDEENGVLLEQVPGGIRVRALQNGRTRYVYALGAPGSRLDYFTAASVPGSILVAAVGPESRTALNLSATGAVIWKREIQDRHISAVELNPDRRHVMIVGNETVYVFRMHDYGE